MTKKIFLSMPMANESKEMIDDRRKQILNELVKLYGTDICLIDQRFDGNENQSPLYCLGYSLQMMAEADFVVFVPDWKYARGCKIEYACCRQYHIPMVDLGTGE